MFFERYAGAEIENVRLHYALYLLGGLSVIFAVLLAVTAFRPRPIYYVPGAAQAGLAYPDRIPESSVLSFASAWLMDWMNYTPETIDGVYARAFRFMGPQLLSKVRARSQEERGKILSDRLSSIFTLKDDARVVSQGRSFRVEIDGQRGVYMGKEEIAMKDVRYIVVVRRVPAAGENIYGLVVEDVWSREADEDVL